MTSDPSILIAIGLCAAAGTSTRETALGEKLHIFGQCLASAGYPQPPTPDPPYYIDQVSDEPPIATWDVGPEGSAPGAQIAAG